jgi:hypothetical protein
VQNGWPVERTAGSHRAAPTRCAGASTVTGGKADPPVWPAFCAFDGEAVISKPNASTLAVPLKVFRCEK